MNPQETAPRLPLVSVIGRPNVGKSTLFNRLTGTRSAIVDSVPGITRDRIEHVVEWRGRWFTLVDTGGIDFRDPDTIPRQIIEQARVAIDTSDLVVMLVDGRAGLNPVEADVAEILRKRGVPVIVAANKLDDRAQNPHAAEFHRLGLGNVLPVSAEQGPGIGDLLDAIVDRFPEAPQEHVPDEVVRIAVIGRPNVGKSSLINRLLGENRVIVSDIPGTTRDAIDVRVKLGDFDAMLVDTAGLRRKGTDEDRIDHVARVMAERAISRSDVALLLVDASAGVTHQDAVIAGLAVEAGCALVVLLNKWDLVEDQEARFKTITDQIEDRLKFATWTRTLTVSVLTGERLHRIGAEVEKAAENRRRRIATAELNSVIEDAMRRHQPPQRGKGKEFKVKYITQVGIKPPAFVAFTTGGLPHFTWQRYLENRLREAFDFAGTPIIIRWRGGNKKR